MREISFYIKSVKVFGIRGIIDFIKRQPQELAFHRKLKNSCEKQRRPIPGITLFGQLSHPNSLSKVMRDLAFYLKSTNIPYQTYDFSEKCHIPKEDIQDLLTKSNEFSLNRYTRTIDIFATNNPGVRCQGVRHTHIIFWEFDNGFKEKFFKCLDGNDILVFSDFCANVIRNEAPQNTRIIKIRYPFRIETRDIPSREKMRQKYNINNDDFVAFFNFSYNSSYYRKNPDGIVKAFAAAFQGKKNVKLVFKTMEANLHPKKVQELLDLAEKLGLKNNLITIDNYIPQQEIYGLTSACDVYISLHRGEGFGLGVAEAMSLGIPVIVTDYSATTEFCNRGNSIPIPYKIIPFDQNKNNIEVYKFVRTCAEPNLDAAAKALRLCYDNRDYAKELGEKGKAFILEYFSPENFKKSISEFISFNQNSK